jgi:hypothetical protein
MNPELPEKVGGGVPCVRLNAVNTKHLPPGVEDLPVSLAIKDQGNVDAYDFDLPPTIPGPGRNFYLVS